MKIVVLINQNLNRTNFERFNLKLNKQSHLNIKYWCILPLYNNDLFIEYEKKEYRSKKDKNFINLKSYLEIYKNLKKINKDTYFLNQSGDNFQSFLIGLVMRLKGCKILKKIEYYNCTTNRGSFLKRLSRLYEFGLIFTLTKILKSFFSLAKNIFLNVFTLKPDYYIIENQEMADELYNKKINKVIKANSSTFSTFYKTRSKNNSKNYFVFIDSEIENSFESKVLNNRHDILNKEKYWKCLNEIFDELSKKFGINVKIAAHFRRGNNNIPIKKKFYFDQTLNLIKNSKFVVAHNSSAIDWAVLFKKPILILNFELFDSIALINRDSIKFFCDTLSLKSINVDLNYNFKLKKNMSSLLKINTKKYQKFSKFQLNYKTNQFPHLSQWEILYNYFKQKNY